MNLNRNLRVEPAVNGGLLYRLLHLSCDLAALSTAWYITREIRVLLNPYMSIWISRTDMEMVAPRLSVLLFLWIGAAIWRGIYRSTAETSLVTAFVRVAESSILVNCLAIILTFFSRHFGAELSRSFVLLFAPISFACLAASFLVAPALASRTERRWPEHKRVAVLGAGHMVRDIAEAILPWENQGTSLRGVILPANFALAGDGLSMHNGFQALPLPVLGTTRELAEVINRESLDRIIVACDTLTEPEVEYCGEVTKRMGVTMSQPIHTVGAEVQVKYQNEYGMHLIDLEAPRFRRSEELIKRALDFAISLTAILLLLPLFAAIALAIKLTSAGPVLYRSRRVGKGGRHFTFWKFRTMYVDGPGHRDLAHRNEGTGHLFKIRRDPRITPLGRILRRFSLDELPQLSNVLMGDMSLVGPRPLPAEDLDPDGMSRDFASWARERAHVPPGITGLWQVRGRSEVPFHQMMELDVEYIRTWSLRRDLAILLETPLVVLTGRGAY